MAMRANAARGWSSRLKAPLIKAVTPKGPVPRENGGVGAISRASTDDSPNIRDDAAQCPEDGHVRPLAGMQHQVANLFAARRASMSQTSTKGSCHRRVRVGRELLHPNMWSPNSSTERDGSSRLLSQVDSL